MPDRREADQVLAFQGVTKAYGDKAVLSSTTLSVARGETLALIGPSGCGKSTLLRLALGLIVPDSGQVLLSGKPLLPADIGEIRLRMGYVIQDGGLFPHLTTAQNVTVVARQQGWKADRMERRLRELAGLVRLPADLFARFPAELSGGQRQRVGIMRALMLDPEVLLMDEPMGALDPVVRHALQSDLKNICRQLNKTVVLVTHDMAEAAYLGDSIALMGGGRVVQRGTLENLVGAPVDSTVSEFLKAQQPALLC